MARRGEIVTVYTAGVIQGVALVTFPAASAVFTSAEAYGLSSTEYGGMFIPQAAMAIASSLLGAGVTRRLRAKRVYLLGLIANLAAMLLLVSSKFVMHEHGLAYGVLLLATAFMGVGFGFTVPTLNTFAVTFFPQKADKAVLWLNALLGLGTVLAPVFIALFTGFGIWWGMPVLVGALILGLAIFSLPQALDEKARAEKTPAAKLKLPVRFWLFAAFMLAYGVCETMNGNWASLYMTNYFGAGAALASAALAIFWGVITGGRVLFASIEKWLPEARVCQILPFIVAGSFIFSACLPKTSPLGGLAAFALAGLGCSALLPLAMSFGQKEFTAIATSVAGGLIAFYQMGYAIAAFGVGPLQAWAELKLNIIFGGTAAVALIMAALGFLITRRQFSPAR